MNRKGKQWYAAPKCMNISVEKRHFFRFPKEHDRWLQWIRASNRLDLEQKGPNYAYNNCTLCHLHFEEKWFRRKTTLCLHPDAVPTLFFGLENTEAEIETREAERQAEAAVQAEAKTQTREEIQGEAEIEPTALIREENQQEENEKRARPAVSIQQKLKADNPREKKLQLKVVHLRKQKKKLQQTVRRLRKKLEQQKKITSSEEESDISNIRKLGRFQEQAKSKIGDKH